MPPESEGGEAEEENDDEEEEGKKEEEEDDKEEEVEVIVFLPACHCLLQRKCFNFHQHWVSTAPRTDPCRIVARTDAQCPASGHVGDKLGMINNLSNISILTRTIPYDLHHSASMLSQV